MTTTATQTGSWKVFQSSLKPEISGERYPFFPIRDVPTEQPITMRVIAGPFFDGFHGGYSLVELDVEQNGTKYRLCVSGARLARAMAAVEPIPGDKLEVTAQGAGKERAWTVRKI